jgi:hypothetical protein
MSGSAVAGVVLLAGPLGITFSDGDGVSAPLVVVVFVALALSPVVLGLVLRIIDRRSDRRGPRRAADRRPWRSWPLGLRIAVLVLAAVVGWGLAALVA